MDWRSVRREKLARAVRESIPLEPERERSDAVRRLHELWERFWAFSLWERSVIIGGCVLAAIAAPVAVVALMGGGGGGQPAVAGPRPTQSAAAATATDTPVPQQTVVNVFIRDTPTPTVPPDRTNCDEIRGTAYRSDYEREWFILNCGEPTFVPDQPPGPPGPPGPPPPVQQPSPTPVPEFTSADAIARAVSWLRSESPTHYTVSAGSCSAISVAGHWVVTCNGSLQGCTGSACLVTVSVCVESTGATRPSDAC